MSKDIVVYNPEIALKLCEEIALGRTITELTREKGNPYPSKATIYRWLMQYPELAKAYAAAREISANSFEEEALLLAREIKVRPGDGTKVRAYEVAMNQLRWSASRRNPQQYGDRGNTNIVVPITINTPLDMGGGPNAGHATIPNIYSIKAKVEQPIDVEFSEVQPPPLEPPPIVAVPPKGTPPILKQPKGTSPRTIRRRKQMTAKAIKEARERYAQTHGEA